MPIRPQPAALLTLALAALAPAAPPRPATPAIPAARLLKDEPLQALADVHSILHDHRARLARLRQLAEESGDAARVARIDHLSAQLDANHARRLDELRQAYGGAEVDRCAALLRLRLDAEGPLARELPATRSLVTKVRRLRAEVMRRLLVRREKERARQRAQGSGPAGAGAGEGP
jgi:hypothetical protein